VQKCQREHVARVLKRLLPADSRLDKTETFGPRSHGHYFRIERAEQLDATFQQWVREAYDSGTQKHFERRGNAARRSPRG
jgi:hypothetical protein